MKKAQQALNNFTQSNGGVSQAFQKNGETLKKFVGMMGNMESTAKTARGQMNEYRNSIEQLSAAYNKLSSSQKAGAEGQAMQNAIGQLQDKFREARLEVERMNEELKGPAIQGGNNYGNMLDMLGNRLGISGNLTELLTSKTAALMAGVGASIAIIGKATSAWSAYNAELSKQDQVTAVTLGPKVGGKKEITDEARAIVDTYGVDFREVINAANTLITQFGESGEVAMSLIRDGMQGMIQGDGPKLLQMIQQFAPAFRDAGISASQLVAIIHNSEGGIFTDQNMNAIVMGIKNIRLMLDTTSKALAKVGIDGEEMTRKLNDGTMTIFQALGEVSSAIQRTGTSSQAAGEVMQYVFGRQGVTAGTNLGKAIESLNLNLQETKKQTGEVGEAYAELEAANKKLNTAIREAFGYDGWDQMAKGIKANLVSALATVIDKLGTIRSMIANMAGTHDESGNSDARVSKDVAGLRASNHKEEKYISTHNEYAREINALQKAVNDFEKDHSRVNLVLSALSKKTGNDYKSMSEVRDDLKIRRAQLAQYEKEAKGILNKPTKTDNAQNTPIDLPTGAGKSGTRITTTKVSAPKEVELPPAGSVQALTKELQELQKEQSLVTSTSEWTRYDSAIDETKQKISLLKGELPKGKEAEITVTADPASIRSMKESLADKEVEMSVGFVPADLINLEKQLEGKEMEVTLKVKNEDSFKQALQATEGFKNRSVQYTAPEEISTPISTEAITAFTANLKKELEGAELGSAIYQSLTEQLADASALGNLIQAAIKNGLDTADFDFKGIGDKILGGTGDVIPDSAWQELENQINEKLAELDIKPIKLNLKTGEIDKTGETAKKTGNEFKKAAGAVQSLGSALQSIENPAAKVAGMIAQAIASVAVSFGNALSESKNPWEWIAAAISGTATMISTIAAIKSATAGSYATGGIVPGNNYNDGLTANVSSGELILNRAQQDVVASQLSTSREREISSHPYLRGEDLYLGINTYLRRAGKGELAISR